MVIILSGIHYTIFSAVFQVVMLAMLTVSCYCTDSKRAGILPVLWARRRRTCFLIVNFARLLLTGATDCAIMIWSRGVAQLGSALGSGPRGRRFESCHSDHIRIIRTLSEWERRSDFLFISNIRISMRCIHFEKLLSPPNRMIFPNAYCIYPADRV